MKTHKITMTNVPSVEQTMEFLEALKGKECKFEYVHRKEHLFAIQTMTYALCSDALILMLENTVRRMLHCIYVLLQQKNMPN